MIYWFSRQYCDIVDEIVQYMRFFPLYSFALMSTRTVYFSSLALGLISWGALAALVIYTQPTAFPQLAAGLMLLMVAIIATATPFWGRIQQRRAPKSKEPVLKSAVRQGVWTALFIAILLVFHFVDLLDWILVLVALMLFVLLETFLQQRGRWNNADTAPQPQKAKKTKRRSSPASSHRSSYSMARTKQSGAKKSGKGKKDGKKK